MARERDHDLGAGDGPGTEVTVGLLLQHAGRPAAADEPLLDELHDAVHRRWIRARRRRAASRWALAAGLTVAVVAALAVVTEPGGIPWRRAVVARWETVLGPDAGDARRVGFVTWRRAAAPQAGVRSGDRITTGSGTRALLRLAGGTRLSLGEESALHLVADRVLRLERGAFWIDTGPASGTGSSLLVSTPHAALRNLGTRFLVRVTADRTVVRIHHGRVVLDRGMWRRPFGAGTELVVSSDAVAQRPAGLPAEDWTWTLDLDPPGARAAVLPEALGWIASALRRPIVFASAELEAEAWTIQVHWPPDAAPGQELLATILASCELTVETETDRLVVGRSADTVAPHPPGRAGRSKGSQR